MYIRDEAAVNKVEVLIARVQQRVLANTGIEISREEAIDAILAYRPDLAEAIGMLNEA
jgi:hypothetical protein